MSELVRKQEYAEEMRKKFAEERIQKAKQQEILRKEKEKEILKILKKNDEMIQKKIEDYNKKQAEQKMHFLTLHHLRYQKMIYHFINS